MLSDGLIERRSWDWCFWWVVVETRFCSWWFPSFFLPLWYRPSIKFCGRIEGLIFDCSKAKAVSCFFVTQLTKRKFKVVEKFEHQFFVLIQVMQTNPSRLIVHIFSHNFSREAPWVKKFYSCSFSRRPAFDKLIVCLKFVSEQGLRPRPRV